MTRIQLLILVCIAFDFIVGIWYSVHRARKAYCKGWDDCVRAEQLHQRRCADGTSDRAYAKEHNMVSTGAKTGRWDGTRYNKS